MYRTVFWTLWEKARVGCFKRTASKYVYYLGWNRSPAQVGCMRKALGPGALGRPRGIGWRGRWEGGSGWGTHVNSWLFHFSVWQSPLQKKKKKHTTTILTVSLFQVLYNSAVIFCHISLIHIYLYIIYCLHSLDYKLYENEDLICLITTVSLTGSISSISC